MKARFIGAQLVQSAKGDFYKLFYSLAPERRLSEFKTDRGDDMRMTLTGDKVFDIPCTPEAFGHTPQLTPGTEYEFLLTPNPYKPAQNLVAGFEAVRVHAPGAFVDPATKPASAQASAQAQGAKSGSAA